MVEIVDLGRGRTKSKGINTEKTPGLLQEYRYVVLAFQLSAHEAHEGTWGIKAMG